MAKKASNNILLHEKVTFIQHHLPGLDAGAYQLTVDQHVNDSDGQAISADALQNVYTFAVQGERFSLPNPASVLYATFPADNDTGEFTQVLPHVVFLKKTFPWIRYPNASEPEIVDVDKDVATWLAVLLLDEDDLDAAKYPGFSLTVNTAATIGDLFPNTLNDKSSLGDNISYFFQAQDTSLEYGETLDDQIQVLDIPLPVFWKIAPALSDLYYLAHARKVSFDNKATQAGISDQGEPVGDFSIVFGNRLPQTGKKASAFLVSLEEMEDYLPNEDGTPPSGKAGDAGKFIRLAVLQNWTFFSKGETGTFVDALLCLNGRTVKQTTDADDTNLRLDPAGVPDLLKNILSMGYAPMNHRLRTGGQTVSWYRGPLVPYNTAPAGLKIPIDSPDQATVFDPTTGMFDVSYATAWTLGRMLALQDKSFSTQLYAWKKTLSRQVMKQIESRVIEAQFQDFLAAGDALPLEEGQAPAGAKALRLKLMELLAMPTKTEQP